MPRKKKNGPTQTDIAREVGLSVSTISRALSNARGISDDVRLKVVGTAAKLGYKGRLTDGVAFERVIVLSRVEGATTSRTFVYQAILGGIRQAVQAVGVDIDFEVASEKTPLPASIDDMLDQSTGLIFVGLTPDEKEVASLHARRVPVVIINGSDPSMRSDIVTPNNFLAGRMAARHLIEQGHTKLMVFTSRLRRTVKRRFQGFEAGLVEGDKMEAELVASVEIDTEDPDQVADRMVKALNTYASKATAVFCTSDMLAFHAIQGLRAVGLRAPDDMSVIGFDNTPVATMISPQLTSVSVDWRMIGVEAVNLLRRRANAPDSPALHVQLAAELVPRESVKQLVEAAA